jgi:molybdopterin synthase sulfurtransferase
VAPVEKYHPPVVDPAWLHDRIGGRRTHASRQESLLIVEVGWQSEGDYRTGHIPGAIYLDTESFERPPSWNMLPVVQLEQVLLSYGLTCHRPVVLYGRDPLAVARAALVLLYAGVDQVRWLDGGIEAWKTAGFQLETGPRSPTPARSFGCPIPAHPEYIVDITQVRLGLADPRTVIACVRTWEEYTGQASGYCYIQARGRIPGSAWAGEPGFEGRQYLPGDLLGQTERRCQEIAGLWKKRGITADKRVIFYCGTGWRASEAFLAAYLMGWKDIAVYDGGWLEWSAEASNLLEV